MKAQQDLIRIRPQDPEKQYLEIDEMRSLISTSIISKDENSSDSDNIADYPRVFIDELFFMIGSSVVCMDAEIELPLLSEPTNPPGLMIPVAHEPLVVCNLTTDEGYSFKVTLQFHLYVNIPKWFGGKQKHNDCDNFFGISSSPVWIHRVEVIGPVLETAAIDLSCQILGYNLAVLRTPKKSNTALIADE